MKNKEFIYDLLILGIKNTAKIPKILTKTNNNMEISV